MSGLAKFARFYCIIILVLWLGPKACFATIEPDEIGVRQSNVSGVAKEDLGPGWALRIPGMHKMYRLPRHYEYLDYTKSGRQSSLQIRTSDLIANSRLVRQARSSAITTSSSGYLALMTSR